MNKAAVEILQNLGENINRYKETVGAEIQHQTQIT